MKQKIYILLLAGLFTISKQTNAQMGAAQKMTLDVDTAVTFNASLQTVWKLVKDPAKWNEISNGYMTKLETSGDLQSTLEMNITFADGTTRVDEVTQFTPQYYFIVNKVKSPLPKGITENIYMFSLVAQQGGGKKMKYSIKVDGAEEGKRQLLEVLKKDMNAFILGIQKVLANRS